MGKGKRTDVYLEVRKRREHIFFLMKHVPMNRHFIHVEKYKKKNDKAE